MLQGTPLQSHQSLTHGHVKFESIQVSMLLILLELQCPHNHRLLVSPSHHACVCLCNCDSVSILCCASHLLCLLVLHLKALCAMTAAPNTQQHKGVLLLPDVYIHSLCLQAVFASFVGLQLDYSVHQCGVLGGMKFWALVQVSQAAKHVGTAQDTGWLWG